jgi:hypothetical protein
LVEVCVLTQRHLLLSPDPLRYTIGAGNSVTVYPDLDVLVDLRIGIPPGARSHGRYNTKYA